MEGAGIYKAITGVMEDVGAVGKNGVNKQQGFKFRSIDDVMNALHPAMVKHKVFTVPEILEQTRETKITSKGTELIFSLCKIRYTFFTEDGSSVQAVVIGEGMDSGDKATNKAMAIAYKYACFQVFCIPTEEMIDPDKERPELEDGSDGNKPRTRGSGNKAAKGKETKKQNDCPEEKVTEAMLNTVKEEMERTGITEKTLKSLYKVEQLKDLTVKQYKEVMNKFKATPNDPSREVGNNE